MTFNPFVSALVSLVFAAQLFAGKVAVVMNNSIGLSEQNAQIICAFMAREYAETAGLDAGDLKGAQAAYDQAGHNIVSASGAIGATDYIVLSATVLNEKIILDAIHYDASGKEKFRSESITAITLDDLPEVMDRLARALYKQTSLAKVLTMDNVTKIEAMESNRLFTEKIFGFKTGIIEPIDADSAFQELINLGFHMKAESKKFFLEFGAGALFPTRFNQETEQEWGYGGVNFEMGASYYLTSNPTASFFIGGGFNPRILFKPGQVVITPYIDFGIMLFRYSSTRFFTNIRIAQNVFDLRYQEWDYTYDPVTGIYSDIYRTFRCRPFEIGLELGMGW